MWTKATVLGGVAALALVAGGAGMAIASAQGTARPELATVAPVGDPTPTVSPGANGAAAAKADHEGLKQILGKIKDFQHAEWVTKGDANTYINHEAILGQVQAVSATSITVKSADGTSMTFAVNDQTKVRQRAKSGSTTPTIADVKQGQTVLVGGAKTPDLTGRNILIRAS